MAISKNSKALISIVQEYGYLWENPKRFKAVLMDVLPEDRQIRNLIILSVEYGLPYKMLEVKNWNTIEKNRLTKGFQDEYGYTKKKAVEIVDIWENVLIKNSADSMKRDCGVYEPISLFFSVEFDYELIFAPVQELGISQRTINALFRNGIQTIRDILWCNDKADLQHYRGLGKHGIQEIVQKLNDNHLSFGMKTYSLLPENSWTIVKGKGQYWRQKLLAERILFSLHCLRKYRTYRFKHYPGKGVFDDSFLAEVWSSEFTVKANSHRLVLRFFDSLTQFYKCFDNYNWNCAMRGEVYKLDTLSEEIEEALTELIEFQKQIEIIKNVPEYNGWVESLVQLSICFNKDLDGFINEVNDYLLKTDNCIMKAAIDETHTSHSFPVLGMDMLDEFTNNPFLIKICQFDAGRTIECIAQLKTAYNAVWPLELYEGIMDDIVEFKAVKERGFSIKRTPDGKICIQNDYCIFPNELGLTNNQEESDIKTLFDLFCECLLDCIPAEDEDKETDSCVEIITENGRRRVFRSANETDGRLKDCIDRATSFDIDNRMIVGSVLTFNHLECACRIKVINRDTIVKAIALCEEIDSSEIYVQDNIIYKKSGDSNDVVIAAIGSDGSIENEGKYRFLSILKNNDVKIIPREMLSMDELRELRVVGDYSAETQMAKNYESGSVDRVSYYRDVRVRKLYFNAAILGREKDAIVWCQNKFINELPWEERADWEQYKIHKILKLKELQSIAEDLHIDSLEDYRNFRFDNMPVMGGSIQFLMVFFLQIVRFVTFLEDN